MKAARELDWWLYFGQVNLANHKEKARRKIFEDLSDKLKAFPFDFLLNEQEAKATVETIVKGFMGGVGPFLFQMEIEVEYIDGRFQTNTTTTTENVVKWIISSLLPLVDTDKIHRCLRCGNIYLAYSDRARFYCCRRCSVLANQGKDKVIIR